MKIIETMPVTIGEYKYWIHPFSAMKAANVSGEVLKVAMPILGAVLPLASKGKLSLDTDVASLTTAFGNSLSGLTGDECEKLFRKLLIDNRNIAVENNEWLTEDVLNERMIGNIVDLYALAWEVIKLNFGDFFSKVFKVNLSGSAPNIQAKTK